MIAKVDPVLLVKFGGVWFTHNPILAYGILQTTWNFIPLTCINILSMEIL